MSFISGTAAGLALFCAPLVFAQAHFYPITPPEGGYDATIWRLSSDGTSAAGSFGRNGRARPMRWTPSEGSFEITSSPDQFGDASAISGAGLVLSGFGSIGGQLVPWSWTEATGMVPLPIPAGALVLPIAISEDGLVIAGSLFAGSVGSFRWTAGMGYQTIPPAGDNTMVHAMSADGSTMTGTFRVNHYQFANFLWRAGRGTSQMPIWTQEWGTPISFDGRLVVGTTDWVASIFDIEAGTITPLTWPDGTPVEGIACGVSADGSVVVGSLHNSTRDAFIWNVEHGARLLVDVLRTDYGLDVGPLSDTMGLSADGAVIAGFSWVVTLREPQPYRGRPPCQGDVDGDQRVGLSDLLFVLGEWRRPEPDLAADITGDGIVDQLDLNIVLVDFGDDCARRRIQQAGR